MKKSITLALETGIYGGSVCLLKDGDEVTGLIGEAEQTKSKEYLESIKKILCNSQISIDEIGEIIFSVGPGSYTGLRIGFSIAKGLKMALGIDIRGVSPLDEMVKNLRPITIAALPFGKTEICWKESGNRKVAALNLQNPINFSPRIDFINVIKQLKPDNLVLPSRLHNELSVIMNFSPSNLNIIHCDENLARLIGRSDRSLIYEEEVKIFYPKPFKVE